MLVRERTISMCDINCRDGAGRDRGRELHRIVDHYGGRPGADDRQQVTKHDRRQRLAEHPGDQLIGALGRRQLR